MKKVIISIGIAFLSIIICVVSMIYVDSTAKNAEKYIDQIQTCISNQQYKLALSKTDEFERFWDNNHTMLSIILHHERLEEIEESIALIKSFLEHPAEENTDCWLEITRSMTKIKNLKDTEKPSLGNIM